MGAGDVGQDGSGGWNGWRVFSVAERVRESDANTSFILQPKDGGPIPPHKPGQYLTLLLDVPGAGELKRTYSISNAPGAATYRITVKREENGRASGWLHDDAAVGTELRVGPPAGEFVLPERPERPVVLLSAGVGLTPMISMLETIAAENLLVETHYLHVTRNGATHAMSERVRTLAAGRPNIGATVFYSRPGADDVRGRDYDEDGRLTVEWLGQHVPAGADYYICGPVPFLRAFVTGLSAAGVGPERLHYEFFGEVEHLLESWPEALDFGSATTAPPPLAEPRQERPIHIPRAEIGEAYLGTHGDAVIVSDREGFIILWNPGAERIFGFTEAEALGQSLDIIIPDALRARHWEGYRETAASGVSRYGAGDLLAVPALRKDGKRISTEFTITMLTDEAGAVTGMIAVLRDVSARFEETRSLKKRVAELEAQVGAAGSS